MQGQPPLCDIPSGCCFFTGPWTVTRSALRMLRRVAAFCRPLWPVLRPVLLLVSFPRSRSPVVGVPGLCWMWRDVPFAHQRRPIIGVLRMCWLLPGSFDCFCCPHTSAHRPSIACLAVFLCGPGALFPTPYPPPLRGILNPRPRGTANHRCLGTTNCFQAECRQMKPVCRWVCANYCLFSRVFDAGCCTSQPSQFDFQEVNRAGNIFVLRGIHRGKTTRSYSRLLLYDLRHGTFVRI